MQFDRLLRLASDDRLVGHVRAGSEPAFEVIYTRHHRGVLSFCRHMLGSAEEAEDALQQTFLAAYSDLVGSSKPINLRPWLYAIARNRCLTMLRARREHALGALEEPATEHLVAEVERRQDLRALLGDVAALPHEQRAALLLTELGDLSHEEIGDVLGCRRDKVKALVFQARSSLIASRTARETPCADIREQIANLRGSSLRRSTLRRHLSDCAGCREFRDQVTTQRREIALILPVAPTLGLKAAVLGAAGVAAGGGGASVVATAAVVVAVAGGGTAAVVQATDDPAPKRATPAAPAARESTSSRAQPGVRGESRRPAARAGAVTPSPVKARKPRPAKSRGNGPPESAPAGARRNGPKAAEVEAPKPLKVKPPRPVKVKAPKPVKKQTVKVKPPRAVKVEAPKPVRVKPETPAKIVVAPPADGVARGRSGDQEAPADADAGSNDRGRGSG